MEKKNNVLQFPKPVAAPVAPSAPAPAVSKPVPEVAKQPGKAKQSIAITGISLLAIALAAATSSRNVFQKSTQMDLASNASGERAIASIEDLHADDRDAAWEKSIAEGLASRELRDVASISAGHDATPDETLRYGVLERKYTILRDLQRNEVESIVLQGTGSEPSFVTNRAEFLGRYGKWMSDKYGFSELKSSELKNDRRFEMFTVFDAQHKAYALAKFELDNYQRLIAFHFEPL